MNFDGFDLRSIGPLLLPPVSDSGKRGAIPSCPLFSSKVAEFCEGCFPENFELFMLLYHANFPFSEVRRGFDSNFGLERALNCFGEAR